MKVLFVSLGCDKNLVDSERMLSSISLSGYTMTDREEEADVIIINTCCFIDDAKEESIASILQMAEYRKSGTCRALIVTGCMAERYRDEIAAELPEVDAVVPLKDEGTIAEVIRRLLPDAADVSGNAGTEKHVPGQGISADGDHSGRVITTGGHYEFLKIAEGCDKHCTYCVIPKIRGRFRSVPMEELVREAECLAADGVKELILVAQETTRYGLDLYGEKSLHVLLEKLCEIEGLRWIRVLYCYPEEIYPALVDVMKRQPKICHYLDLPIQHADDDILKKMGRKTCRKDLEELIGMLRREIPDIVLRTTLITGFPGETEEQHQNLMSFIDDMEFDRLGVFCYSQEEGTPAALMPDQVDAETKERRRDELLTLQQEVAAEAGERRIGTVMEIMVEGFLSDENAYVARTYGDAPDVDGYFFMNSPETWNTGDFLKARVTGADVYDLIGVPEDEFTE